MTMVARFIALIHLICIAYLILGWALPKNYLLMHLISVPAVIIHWWLNNNQCILTQLQSKFEEVSLPQEKAEGHFTRDLFKKLGLELTDRQLFIVIYLILILSALASLYRIL